MKKTAFLAVFAAMLTCFTPLIQSCSFGLEPAWKSSALTTLAFKLGSLPRSGADRESHAIVQGNGFLYLRTVGGPGGGGGPLYGPFPVTSGSEFVTTLVPAGRYDWIGVLYAARTLDEEKTVSGLTLTLGQMLRLPDDQFIQLIEGSENGDQVNAFFDGEASGGFLQGVTIVEGTRNAFSLTLKPLTCAAYTVDFTEYTGGSPAITLPAGTRARKFVHLMNCTKPAGLENIVMVCTIGAVGSPAGVGILALYGQDGRLLDQLPPAGTVSTSSPVRRTASWPAGYDEPGTAYGFYLYIEYSGTVSLAFVVEGDEAVTGMLVDASMTGASAYDGKTVYLALIDQAEAVVAVTSIAVASGSGSSAMLDPVFLSDSSVTTPVRLEAGTYQAQGFVDMDGDAADMEYSPDSGDVSTSSPHEVVISDTAADPEHAVVDPAWFDYTWPVPAEGPVAFTGTSLSGCGGKRLFFALFDAAAVDDAIQTASDSGTEPDLSAIDPFAIGIMQLDALGTGAAVPYLTGTATAFAPVADAGYYVAGFIDMSGAYDSITDVSALTDTSMIQPLYGDYVTQGEVQGMLAVTADGEGRIALAAEAFAPCMNGIYFIQDGADGTGLSPYSPGSWATAVAALASAAAGDATIFFLTGDVTVDSPETAVALGTNLYIGSYPDATHTITLEGTFAAPFIAVGDGGSLVLADVTVDGSGATFAQSPFTVAGTLPESMPSCALLEGSVLRNMAVTGAYGGAVSASSGLVLLSGGTITGCLAIRGGGIYAASGALVVWDSGSITDNRGYENGGGVFLERSSSGIRAR